jgi:O-antigen/teichoic acid export membrane protein
MVRPGAPQLERERSEKRFAERARRHLADPLFRNAYALMFNAGATGALGLVYWILAARYYDDADVGRGSAAISAMMLLSGFTALNLTGMVSRFLPRAGPATRSFILKTYLASSLAAGVITVGFLLTVDRWGPSYARLTGLWAGLGFTVAVIAWGVFTLQDAVLPALRSAVWVPLENVAFGVLKIAFVVGLAAALPHDGVFLSWVIPVALSIVPINLLILLRLGPRHVRATEGGHARPETREVRRFLAGDYAGGLFVLGAVYLVPVAVAAQVGPRTNAYFFVAWTIGAVIDLLAVNMAISLTVEGTLDLDRLAANTRAALRRMIRILLPIVGATILLAYPTLSIYGSSYAQNGARLLQLLALSALPRALVEIYFGALRAQSRTSRVAVLQGVRCAMVIGLAILFTNAFGITGAGLAVLIGQSVTAALAVPELLTVLGRRPGFRPAGPGLRLTRRLRVVVRQLVRALSSAARLPLRWPLMTLGILAAVSLALFFLPLRRVRLEEMSGYGLVSVLPVVSLMGLGLLTLGYVLTLALKRPHPVFLTLQLVALVECLHGVTAFVESEPRFPTAWQHLGFLDYIGRTGDVAPALDARFNWPGFFAVATFFSEALGISDPTALLKPAPVVAELLYLVPYVLLLSCIRANWRTKWFAAFLLVASNWVGQDYFSPQSFNFFVYLLTLAFVLTWFGLSRSPLDHGPAAWARSRVSRLRPPAALTRWRVTNPEMAPEPGELPPRPATTRQRTALVVLVIGLFVVSTASHQITPFMILVAVAALVLVGRCELTGLPLLFGVITMSWLSYMATGYWTGHLGEIFGNVGSLGSNVEASVQGRAVHSSPEHATVLSVRLALAAGLFGLAVLGALRRRRNGVHDRTLLVLAVAPISALGLQSYGGEVGLRVFLFALPALCLLAASLFFGVWAGGRSWVGLSAAFACAVVLIGGFLVARYGNERSEHMTAGEIAALDYVYDHDDQGARLMWLTPAPHVDATPSMPWGARDIEHVEYVSAAAPRDPADVYPVLEDLQGLGPNGYLIVNRAQTAYLELKYSFPPAWGERIRANLDATPGVRRVFATDDAAVYALASPPPGPLPDEPPSPGFSILSTRLTPIGIVATVLLIAVLVAREVRRVRLPHGARARLAPLDRTACVLFVVWAAVVVERFVHLA